VGETVHELARKAVSKVEAKTMDEALIKTVVYVYVFTSYYVSLHYVSLHYVSLHYVSLHYVSLHSSFKWR
jgi:hypothetical protein